MKFARHTLAKVREGWSAKGRIRAFPWEKREASLGET
jgi:hypothetical protein